MASVGGPFESKLRVTLAVTSVESWAAPTAFHDGNTILLRRRRRDLLLHAVGRWPWTSGQAQVGRTLCRSRIGDSFPSSMNTSSRPLMRTHFACRRPII